MANLLQSASERSTWQTVRQVAPPDRMRAAQIAAPQQVCVTEVPVPTPNSHEVLVKVEGCGLCGSNLPLWEGREWFTYPLPPGNPGHEGWGHIVALGDAVDNGVGNGLQVGDRVAMLSYNAFAQYDLADAGAVVKLPSQLDGQPFPGEPLACALNVFARSRIEPGQTVAIVGIGFLGALLTALAAHAGARVIAITRRPFALEMARHFGAQELIEMDDHWRVIAQVQALTHRNSNLGAGCDCVIEAVGAQWPLDLAAELTRVRGHLVVAGYHQDGLRQVNMQLWNWRGLDVTNAHERDPHVYMAGLRAAIEMVGSGELDPSPLYTHHYPLHELDRALATMQARPEGFLKALVQV